MRTLDKFCVGEFHFAGQCDEEKCHIERNAMESLTRITEIICRYIDDRYRFCQCRSDRLPMEANYSFQKRLTSGWWSSIENF